MSTVKEYDARIDLKKRVTIRGAHYEYYHVTEFSDGRIVLEPRELVAPFEVSQRTLASMDAAMTDYKAGKVSLAVDLSTFVETE